MKIASTIGNVAFLERMRKNEDATRKDEGNAGYHPQEKHEPKEERDPPSPEHFQRALVAHEKDPAMQALGLEAEVEGEGPGLRVTLKDGSGARVRQFTGQEFLDMREAAQVTGRGKLLDKKF